ALFGSSQNPEDSTFSVFSKGFTLDTEGNLVADGSVSTPHLTVSGDVLSDRIPSGSFSLGSSSNPWSSLYVTSLALGGNIGASGSLALSGSASISNSFYVNSNGRVGIGTSTPVT